MGHNKGDRGTQGTRGTQRDTTLETGYQMTRETMDKFDIGNMKTR